jgi:hypothetical protein
MTKRSMGDPLVDGFAFHRRQGSVRERVQCDPFLAIQESALKRASLRKPITASVSPMGNDRAADPARTRTTHTSIQRARSLSSDVDPATASSPAFRHFA